MTTAHQSKNEHALAHSPDVFRMSEFDAVAEARSVAEALRDNLESAEAQLQIQRQRAERAQQRAQDLFRAVNNWHELIEDYERATHSSTSERMN
jgi:hypothetical protein